MIESPNSGHLDHTAEPNGLRSLVVIVVPSGAWCSSHNAQPYIALIESRYLATSTAIASDVLPPGSTNDL